MSWNKPIRQTHRWMAVAFTLCVVANFVAIGMGLEPPPPWITYSPLLPLALLWCTGAYLFVLPYFARLRNDKRIGVRAD